MIEIAQETRTQSVQCMVKRRRGHTGLTSLACFLPRTSSWRGGGVSLLDAGAGGNAAALLAGIAAAAGAGSGRAPRPRPRRARRSRPARRGRSPARSRTAPAAAAAACPSGAPAAGGSWPRTDGGSAQHGRSRGAGGLPS